MHTRPMFIFPVINALAIPPMNPRMQRLTLHDGKRGAESKIYSFDKFSFTDEKAIKYEYKYMYISVDYLLVQ